MSKDNKSNVVYLSDYRRDGKIVTWGEMDNGPPDGLGPTYSVKIDPGQFIDKQDGIISDSRAYMDNAIMVDNVVVLPRENIRAERWLFANRVPMKVRETEECTEFAFETDEGIEITLGIGSDDTAVFVAKISEGVIKDVKPGVTTGNFCSFHIVEGNETLTPALFVTRPDLKARMENEEE